MSEQTGQTNRLFTGLIVGAIFGLGVGLLVGLFFAYIVAPVEYVDCAPQDLREDYASYYLQLVAESYATHGNLELAKKQLGPWDDPEQLKAVLDRARIESSPETKMALDSLMRSVAEDLAAQPAETPAPGETPAAEGEGRDLTSLLITVLIIIGLLVLALVVVALLVSRGRKKRAEEPAAVAEEETPEWLATMRPGEAPAALPALGHFVTSYALGNDHYDESFSIETSAGEFLGECGVGISETIGVGEPDKVTAFEVWLFDKNDIRTVTKVMMSEHAFHDQELRNSLASKGEAVLVQINEPIVLDTATLRVEATVTEATYGEGALPPNSFFERLTVELTAHQEETPAGEPPSEEDDTIVEA
jgi:hypothetical protein